MITPGIVAATQAAAIGTGGTEFTPPVTSGLQLYVDARYHDALSNGDNVSTWTDLSGNARDLPAATGGSFVPPTLARDTFGTGAHSMRMGTNKAFRVPVFYGAYTAAEVFCVVKVDADPPGAANGLWTWYLGSGGGGVGAPTYYPHPDGNIYDAFAKYVAVNVGNPARSLTLVNVVNVSHQSGASDYVYRLNETTLSTTTGALAFDSATPAYFGHSPSGVWFNGNLGALLLFNRVLTSTERSDTYAWLQAQWPGLP